MIQLINERILDVEDGLIVCDSRPADILNMAVKQKYPNIRKNIDLELGSCHIAYINEDSTLAVAFLSFMDDNENTQLDKLKESLERLKEIVDLNKKKCFDKIIFPYGFGCNGTGDNWGKIMQLIELFAEQVDKEVVFYAN